MHRAGGWCCTKVRNSASQLTIAARQLVRVAGQRPAWSPSVYERFRARLMVPDEQRATRKERGAGLPWITTDKRARFQRSALTPAF
jgi:hypothetical protein